VNPFTNITIQNLIPYSQISQTSNITVGQIFTLAQEQGYLLISFMLRRIRCYQNDSPNNTYIPMYVQENATGFRLVSEGVPGVSPPRLAMSVPAHLALPFKASDAVTSLYSFAGVEVFQIDLVGVSQRPSSLLNDTLDDQLAEDFQIELSAPAPLQQTRPINVPRCSSTTSARRNFQ